MAHKPTIAISAGDPGGIGPEIVVKALADRPLRSRAHFRIYGCVSALEDAAHAAAIEPFWWRIARGSTLLDTTLAHEVVVVDSPDAAPFPHQPTRAGGELSFRFVEDAIADAKRPLGDPLHAHAVVTAPISKTSWSLAGHANFPGHTELFAHRFGAKRVAMLFHAGKLNIVLATVHIPLMDIRNHLTIGRVFDAIDLGSDALKQLGISAPRIAVCGLNPHAGENGLLGDEEDRLIRPATRAAKEAGIDAHGPFPADTVFNSLVRGDFDLVVAMYHDQGLIPIKLLAWDRAVNITVGLPIPRTSPDHGTAFDIAGKNAANPGSMRAAIEAALTLADHARR